MANLTVEQRIAAHHVATKDNTSGWIVFGIIGMQALNVWLGVLASGGMILALAGYLGYAFLKDERAKREIEAGNTLKYLPPDLKAKAIDERMAQLEALEDGDDEDLEQPQVVDTIAVEPEQPAQPVIAQLTQPIAHPPMPRESIRLVDVQPVTTTPAEDHEPVDHAPQDANYIDDAMWDWQPKEQHDDTPVLNLALFDQYPTCLIWGGHGSGKTTTVRAILSRRARLGHKIAVLNPHAKRSDWEGYKLVGGGMDYGAIAGEMEAFSREVHHRYKRINECDEFAPVTFVCEEFTNWAARIGEQAGELLTTSMSDTRKVDMSVIYVAHDRTLSILGNTKGISKMRDASLLELELVTKIDEVTGKAVSAGYGYLKLPSQKPYKVRVPFELIEAELALAPKPKAQPPKPVEVESEQPNPFELPPVASAEEETLAAMRSLKAEHPELQKKQIIEQVTGAKPGGGKAYTKWAELWDGKP